MSAFTPNKDLELPANDSYIGTWDVPVNSNFSIIDSCFGAITAITVSNVDVFISQAQTQCFAFLITGTLSSSIAMSLPDGLPGEYIFINSSSGAGFTITLSVSGQIGGQTVVIPQGVTSTVYSDGTHIHFSSNLSGYGIQGINVSNVDIAITPHQTNNFAFIISGVLSGPVTINLPQGLPGQYTFINNSTLGSTHYVITVSMNSQVGGTTVILPQAASTIVYCDGLQTSSPKSYQNSEAWWYVLSDLSTTAQKGFSSVTNPGLNNSIFTFTTPQPTADYCVMITPYVDGATPTNGCSVQSQTVNRFTIIANTGTSGQLYTAVTVFR